MIVGSFSGISFNRAFKLLALDNVPSFQFVISVFSDLVVPPSLSALARTLHDIAKVADGRKEKPIRGEGRTERETERERGRGGVREGGRERETPCREKKERKASELGTERERVVEGTKKRETGGSECGSAGGRGRKREIEQGIHERSTALVSPRPSADRSFTSMFDSL